jgi:hypothetical protein
VFVTYAPDSIKHEKDVLHLCHLLVSNGVDARCDKWAQGERRGWGEWAEAEIQAADYVLAVASPAFRWAGNDEPTGREHRRVRAEVTLLRELLQQDRPTWRRRILPVLLPAGSWTDIPVFLSPCNDTRFEVSAFTVEGADELIRFLTEQPQYVPPAPGAPPHLPSYQMDGGSAEEAAPDAGRGLRPEKPPRRWPLLLILVVAVITTAATSPLWYPARSSVGGLASPGAPGRDGSTADPTASSPTFPAYRAVVVRGGEHLDISRGTIVDGDGKSWDLELSDRSNPAAGFILSAPKAIIAWADERLDRAGCIHLLDISKTHIVQFGESYQNGAARSDEQWFCIRIESGLVARIHVTVRTRDAPGELNLVVQYKF